MKGILGAKPARVSSVARWHVLAHRLRRTGVKYDTAELTPIAVDQSAPSISIT